MWNVRKKIFLIYDIKVSLYLHDEWINVSIK